MTPAEVIAMRDKLRDELLFKLRDDLTWDQCINLAESLIKSGWVVAPPKNEGERRDERTN